MALNNKELRYDDRKETPAMDLKKNPFYVINVACDADRAAINAAAELLFFDESGEIEAAQLALLNPSKRLTAEMDWFPDLPHSAVAEIRMKIAENASIPSIRGGGWITQLNIATYNFGFLNLSQENMIEILLRFDLCFSHLKAEEVASMINCLHLSSGMPMVRYTEIADQMNRKKAEIRHVITERLNALEEERYLQIITQLAKIFVGSQAHGGIVEAVLDQYEIRVSESIKLETEKISESSARLRNLDGDAECAEESAALVETLKQWSKLVKPLQFRGQATGMTYEPGKKMGWELRRLIVSLHNERHATITASTLAEAACEIFCDYPELYSSLEKDRSILSGMAEQKKRSDAVAEINREVQNFQHLTDTFSQQAEMQTEDGIAKLINTASFLGFKIEELDVLDNTEKEKMRTTVFSLCREAAVKLHNDKGKTEEAISILIKLEAFFSDIPSVSSRLQVDMEALKAAGSPPGRKQDPIKKAAPAAKDSEKTRTADSGSQASKGENRSASDSHSFLSDVPEGLKPFVYGAAVIFAICLIMFICSMFVV